jgi:hypothetical protein
VGSGRKQEAGALISQARVDAEERSAPFASLTSTQVECFVATPDARGNATGYLCMKTRIRRPPHHSAMDTCPLDVIDANDPPAVIFPLAEIDHANLISP